MPDQQPATPKIFTIAGVTEAELSFLINATFGVQINSADARLVSDLQQRLIAVLNPPPVPEVIETAVV